MKYGLQLYSVRDSAAENFEQMLQSVANMGYSFVESAGFYDRTAEQVKKALDKNGLTLCGTHTSLRQLCDKWEETIAFHKTVGCYDIIIPGAHVKTAEEIHLLVDTINCIIPKMEKEGMRLHYHNHYQEFMPNADGLIPLNELASRTKIFFEIDTFWALDAGLDPLTVLEQYADRIKLIHLKDGIPQDWSNPQSKAIGKSLGEGQAPIQAILQKAEEMKLTVVVESEDLDPCGLDEVARCIRYLQRK